MKYPIPQHSATALRAMSGKPTNPGLIFDRFAPDWGDAPSKNEISAWKKAGLQAVIDHRADSSLLEATKSRWEAVAKASQAEPFPMKTDWRFIAGLGNKGPLEVGFRFDRYGFPTLPGSSVKGLARAGAREILGVSDDTDHPEFIAVFGNAPKPGEDESITSAGKAIFFDAIPTRVPQLQMEIMNPHYPEYYQKKEFPTDWQSPIPVFFLTVAPGQEFCFAVGWRGKLDVELRDKAAEWLKFGLEDLGAGAKTSAGYGYFIAQK